MVVVSSCAEVVEPYSRNTEYSVYFNIDQRCIILRVYMPQSNTRSTSNRIKLDSSQSIVSFHFHSYWFLSTCPFWVITHKYHKSKIQTQARRWQSMGCKAVVGQVLNRTVRVDGKDCRRDTEAWRKRRDALIGLEFTRELGKNRQARMCDWRRVGGRSQLGRAWKLRIVGWHSAGLGSRHDPVFPKSFLTYILIHLILSHPTALPSLSSPILLSYLLSSPIPSSLGISSHRTLLESCPSPFQLLFAPSDAAKIFYLSQCRLSVPG